MRDFYEFGPREIQLGRENTVNGGEVCPKEVLNLNRWTPLEGNFSRICLHETGGR